MELSIHIIYNFIGGPLVWISFLVFITGTIFQIHQFFTMTRERRYEIFANRPQKKLKIPGIKEIKTRLSLVYIKQNIGKIKDFFSKERLPFTLAKIKNLTVLGVNPFMTIVTTVFHICLVIAPVLVYAHNILLDEAFGISFFSFSEKTTDIMTVIVLACGAIFLLRRIISKRVRAITTIYDYIIFLIAIGPFLTGFLAYHQIYDYKLMIILHILSGEIMLIAIPFTKLVHMIFFFINRIYIGSEYSFCRGTRTW